MSAADHFNNIAKNYDSYKRRSWYYYAELKSLLSSLIPPHNKVLEFGCGTGDLLYHLNPSHGVGIDISSGMIRIAKSKYSNHRNLKFMILSRFNASLPHAKYQYIFLSDVIEHLDDVKAAFRLLSSHMSKSTKLICTMANPIWEPILMIAERLGLKMPEGPHHRIKFSEIRQILQKQKLQVIEHDHRLLAPIWIPSLSWVINKLLFPYLRKYGFITYFVAVKEDF